MTTRLDPRIDQVRIYITPLTRLKFRIFPMRHSDMPLLERFEQFFARPEVCTLGMSQSVFEQATELRAQHRLFDSRRPAPRRGHRRGLR
ncbi:hypothetical protein [Thermochromatium tepidum]|uniref:hypothetical protein n=1 Tax=Thermochromatium tepidum TaxID=1050 RepID=UPI001478DD53|nr:hypothetical protein [Thermochromatium tepidum]